MDIASAQSMTIWKSYLRSQWLCGNRISAVNDYMDIVSALSMTIWTLYPRSQWLHGHRVHAVNDYDHVEIMPTLWTTLPNILATSKYFAKPHYPFHSFYQENEIKISWLFTLNLVVWVRMEDGWTVLGVSSPLPPPNDGNHINDGPSHIIIDTSFKELAPTPHECRLLYAVQYSTGNKRQ